MLLWLMIIAGVIFLDQLTKWLTVINLEYIPYPGIPDTFPIIKDVFHFTHTRNPGMAFGMLGEENQRWIFMTVSTIAIVAMFIYLWINRKGSKLMCVAFSFIIGGGIGNMIDRCFLGYVTDFIDFRIINFAIFNIADSFVCIGVGMFALYIILDEIKQSKLRKEEALNAENQEESEKAEVEDSTEEIGYEEVNVEADN